MYKKIWGIYGGKWLLIGWAAVFDTVVFTGKEKEATNFDGGMYLE